MEERKPNGDLPLRDVKIDDRFWSGYQKLVREKVIPYQWEALNDRVEGAEPSGVIHNLRIAAGLDTGEYVGLVFQDSDLAKWMEAAAYSLETHPDAELEKLLDSAIELLAAAQREDGYLNSWYIVKEPGKRWTNLYECHELYCAGHLLEAAVAHFRATGKSTFLDVMRRYVEEIARVFGTAEGQLRGYDGHEEIELALVKLYHATHERRYLELAQYSVDERGNHAPFYFDVEWEKRGRTFHWTGIGDTPPSQRADYNQAHLPVRRQKSAEGHSVRAVYLYTAMADLAAETGDGELAETCRALWANITQRRMYVTGAIGSQAFGERFTFDYDLPNDTVYAETCASIGLIFFAHRMLRLGMKGEYADVLERALYNTVLAGMAQDGRHFFYVNPLEVWPEASQENQTRQHVLVTRPPWFGCACCPPNVARLLSSLGQYVYTVQGDTVFTHLYVGSTVKAAIGSKTAVLHQITDYPMEGHTKLVVEAGIGGIFTVALRLPGWCAAPELLVNGQSIELPPVVRDGYAYLERAWKAGDTVELVLPMEPRRIRANPAVRADIGRVAIQRGPLVYCLEQADNGANLQALTLPAAAALHAWRDDGFFGGADRISAHGFRVSAKEGDEAPLYAADAAPQAEEAELQFIPYHLWANREPGEMLVWVREG